MINQLAKEIHANARAKGFYDAPFNYGEKAVLIISEISESVEADRTGKGADIAAFQKRYDELVASINTNIVTPENAENLKKEYFVACFKKYVKDSKADELADAIIRILDVAEYYRMDMEKHIELKMKYNSYREFMHGKNY